MHSGSDICLESCHPLSPHEPYIRKHDYAYCVCITAHLYPPLWENQLGSLLLPYKYHYIIISICMKINYRIVDQEHRSHS